MRDVNRIPIVMDKLQELWLLMPDIRFGQLFYIINETYNDGKDYFNIEEDKWLEWIENEIRKRKK